MDFPTTIKLKRILATAQEQREVAVPALNAASAAVDTADDNLRARARFLELDISEVDGIPVLTRSSVAASWNAHGGIAVIPASVAVAGLETYAAAQSAARSTLNTLRARVDGLDYITSSITGIFLDVPFGIEPEAGYLTTIETIANAITASIEA